MTACVTSWSDAIRCRREASARSRWLQCSARSACRDCVIAEGKASCREPAMKPVGKPDAGNPHVRFDERGRETDRTSDTAPLLDSTALAVTLSAGFTNHKIQATRPPQVNQKTRNLVGRAAPPNLEPVPFPVRSPRSTRSSYCAGEDRPHTPANSQLGTPHLRDMMAAVGVVFVWHLQVSGCEADAPSLGGGAPTLR
jgi:hypothetical protein